MSKILIDEATVKLVLEALNSVLPRHLTPLISNARTALREALAEQPAQQEPVLVVEVEPDYMSGGHHHKGSKPHINLKKLWSIPIGTKLYTTPQPAQQPFGYFKAEPFGWTDCAETDEGAVALYERPPAQRKPLTDEEWQNIADTLGCFINRGQKDAIEAALGIKENT